MCQRQRCFYVTVIVLDRLPLLNHSFGDGVLLYKCLLYRRSVLSNIDSKDIVDASLPGIFVIAISSSPFL